MTMHPVSVDLHPAIPVLERELMALPPRSIPLNPSGHLSIYEQASLQVVRRASVLQRLTAIIHAPAMSSVISLHRKVGCEMEQQIQQLPIRWVKNDPLRPFHATATLVLEEEYVELEQVLEVVRGFGDRLLQVEVMTIRAIAHLIGLKSDWLNQAGVDGYGMGGAFPVEIQERLPLAGEAEDVERARLLCGGAIALLHYAQVLDGLTEGAIALLEWVVMSLPTDWWLKHEHCAGQSVLLLLNETLDEVVVKQGMKWE